MIISFHSKQLSCKLRHQCTIFWSTGSLKSLIKQTQPAYNNQAIGKKHSSIFLIYLEYAIIDGNNGLSAKPVHQN